MCREKRNTQICGRHFVCNSNMIIYLQNCTVSRGCTYMIMPHLTTMQGMHTCKYTAQTTFIAMVWDKQNDNMFENFISTSWHKSVQIAEKIGILKQILWWIVSSYSTLIILKLTTQTVLCPPLTFMCKHTHTVHVF